LIAKAEQTLRSATQSLLSFYCKFAVRLCTQVLLAKYIADTDAPDLSSIFEFDANLVTIC